MLLSALAAAVHRRHLFVWAIFAPKFVTDGGMHVVSLLALAAVRHLGLAGLLRSPPVSSFSMAEENKPVVVASIGASALRAGVWFLAVAAAWKAFVALVVSG